MQKGLMVFTLLILIAGAIYAADSNTTTCTTEGKTMPVYPGYACCDGLTPIPTTATSADGTIQTLIGASICSKCGDAVCDEWENYANCSTDCAKPAFCAKEGAKYSQVYADYPKKCCEGLTEWESGMDTREVVDGQCMETGRLSGSPIGTCINCGDKICGEYENICNCKEDCEKTADSETCVCTMEYAPVCGTDGVTYGNACGAKCAKIEIAYQGECTTKNCPEIILPECQNGKITYTYDANECPTNPVCSNSTGDFYKTASWKCSDGQEYKEEGQDCLPYSFWKEKARNTCAQLSAKCNSFTTTSTASGGASMPVPNNVTTIATPATGVLTGITAEQAKTTTAAATTSTTNTTNAASVSNSAEVQTKCADAEVYVIDFRVSDQCRPECEEYTDAQGCKVINCPNGLNSVSCATEPVCYAQSWEEIKNIKEKCLEINGEGRMDYQGDCVIYSCKKPDDINATQTTNDSNHCLTSEEVPQEKKSYCEKTGGKFIIKTNEDGCIAYVDCIGANTTESSTSQRPINKEILSDKTKLLSLAVSLEGLKVDLQKTIAKIQAIGDYYTEQGDTNYAAKFSKAAFVLKEAVTSIDETKTLIKDNIDTFNEEEAIIVRNKISNIRETLLKEALLAMIE